MTRVTRPFTVEIKRSRIAARPNALAAPASPASPAFLDAPLNGSALIEEPSPRPVADGSGGAAARLAAEALFSGAKPLQRPDPLSRESEQTSPAGGRILADLNAKDPLEELIRARAEDGSQRRAPRQVRDDQRNGADAALVPEPARDGAQTVKARTTRRSSKQIARAAALDGGARPVASGQDGAGPRQKRPPETKGSGWPSAPAAADAPNAAPAASWSISRPTAAANAAPGGRKRRGDVTGLARGERWKRRLPEICR